MAHDQNDIPTWPLHEQAKRLWQAEGGHCVSSLVATLATGGGYGGEPRELFDLAEQAAELAFPIEDWESTAAEGDWHQEADETWYRAPKFDGEEEALRITADTAQEACDLDQLEVHQREVFEHWIVSDWLADQLEAKGEKVDKDFAGMTIWARTTTGQAVYADHVIEKIAAETYGRKD